MLLLLYPSGLLSRELDSSAIKAANDEAIAAIENYSEKATIAFT